MLKLVLLAVCVSLAASTGAAPRSIPTLSGPVIDEANVLGSKEVEALSNELRSYPPKVQLQIWIVDSLQDEPIENLSIRATSQWKLGSAKEDKGALLLIAVKDHRMRLEVGQGLEGDITDLQSSRILDQTIRPAFRQEAYFQGILMASRQVYQLAGGDPQNVVPLREGRPVRERGTGQSAAIIIFIIVMLILRLFTGGRSRFYGGGGGWGGGGFGGGGGGWSGGGGGFSGGGSSSSW